MFYNISGLILDRLTVTEKVRQEQKKTFNRIVERYRINPNKTEVGNYRARWKNKKGNKHTNSLLPFFYVIRMRFELMTHALEGRCSIQLSYQTKHSASFLKRCKSSFFFLKLQHFRRNIKKRTYYVPKKRYFCKLKRKQ